METATLHKIWEGCFETDSSIRLGAVSKTWYAAFVLGCMVTYTNKFDLKAGNNGQKCTLGNSHCVTDLRYVAVMADDEAASLLGN